MIPYTDLCEMLAGLSDHELKSISDNSENISNLDMVIGLSPYEYLRRVHIEIKYRAYTAKKQKEG